MLFDHAFVRRAAQRVRRPLAWSFGSLVLAAFAVLASPVAAQETRSLAGDMVSAGQWELSTAGRDKTCVLTLKSDAVPLGLKIELEKDCGDALPFAKAITSWSIKGLDIVRLQDAKGESVIDFTEVESGIFEGVRQGEGVYLLQNLVAARALSKSTDQLIGDWIMTRDSGKTVCGLTLTNTEASPDNFAVYLKPRCESEVTAFNPVVWRIERGELLLQSASGSIWRFEADDNAQWRRVPDGPDPLILMRQ